MGRLHWDCGISGAESMDLVAGLVKKRLPKLTELEAADMLALRQSSKSLSTIEHRAYFSVDHRALPEI